MVYLQIKYIKRRRMLIVKKGERKTSLERKKFKMFGEKVINGN